MGERGARRGPARERERTSAVQEGLLAGGITTSGGYPNEVPPGCSHRGVQLLQAANSAAQLHNARRLRRRERRNRPKTTDGGEVRAR